MVRLFFGLGPLLASAASAANLRHATDLVVDHRSKHVVEERTSQSSVLAPSVVTIKLTNYKGMEYAGAITVGGQSLMAIYDTGSYDVMAVSDQCGTCRIPKKMKVFANKSSRSFKKGPSSDTFEHYFAGGVITARLDYDTVELGSGTPIAKAENMPIWQVTDTDLPQWVTPEHCKFTVVVGLGFGKVAPDTPAGLPPVVQLLERAGADHFSICLENSRTSPGYIQLNPPYDFQAPSFTTMFRKLAVIGHKHWAVEHKGVSYFNGDFTDTRCGSAGECVAIIDSGTSLIGVPGMHMMFIQDFASRIMNDCSNLGELPDLMFNLGDHTFALPASAYVLQLDGKCYAAFMQVDLASDRGLVWVLGLPFLRHYYTVWDRKGPSLYIAEQGDKCKPKPFSNSSVQLAHTPGSLGTHIEPSLGDIREARRPSWAPPGSQKVTI